MNYTEAETGTENINQVESFSNEKPAFDKDKAYIDSAQLETQESPEKGGEEEESKIPEKEHKRDAQEENLIKETSIEKSNKVCFMSETLKQLFL